MRVQVWSLFCFYGSGSADRLQAEDDDLRLKNFRTAVPWPPQAGVPPSPPHRTG